MMDPCTDEELAAFAAMSAWCWKTKHTIRVKPKKLRQNINDLRGIDFVPKVRQPPKSSIEKQAERRAIDKLVWGR